MAKIVQSISIRSPAHGNPRMTERVDSPNRGDTVGSLNKSWTTGHKITCHLFTPTFSAGKINRFHASNLWPTSRPISASYETKTAKTRLVEN
jgi:hypothetical protein